MVLESSGENSNSPLSFNTLRCIDELSQEFSLEPKTTLLFKIIHKNELFKKRSTLRALSRESHLHMSETWCSIQELFKLRLITHKKKDKYSTEYYLSEKGWEEIKKI